MTGSSQANSDPKSRGAATYATPKLRRMASGMWSIRPRSKSSRQPVMTRSNSTSLSSPHLHAGRSMVYLRVSCFWKVRKMLSFLASTFAVALMFAPSAPALAVNLDFVSQGRADEAILSDGVSNENGQWQSKVQLVFNSKTQRIERRLYHYFV